MAPRKNYTPDQIEKAVEAVNNGEKVAVAAKRFGVPRITLHDKITGKTPIGCAVGPSTILTKSEEDKPPSPFNHLLLRGACFSIAKRFRASA